MFNAKRLFGFLATGVMPERTALDAAIALAEAMDAIDFAAHDRRYHGGAYDPQTMTCGMRQALEKGDLADVLAAEEEEERQWKKYIKKHPELMTDAEFSKYYGRPSKTGQYRIEMFLHRFYKPARQDGGGTLLGEVDGVKVYPHSKMPLEMSRSRNAFWLLKNDPSAFSDKSLIIRDLKKHVNAVSIDERQEATHKSDSHSHWQVANGFATAPFTFNGKPWYFVFTVTNDGRYLLYDVVQKNKGKVSE